MSYAGRQIWNGSIPSGCGTGNRYVLNISCGLPVLLTEKACGVETVELQGYQRAIVVTGRCRYATITADGKPSSYICIYCVL